MGIFPNILGDEANLLARFPVGSKFKDEDGLVWTTTGASTRPYHGPKLETVWGVDFSRPNTEKSQVSEFYVWKDEEDLALLEPLRPDSANHKPKGG
jgi:hypothetical protein